MRRLFKLAVVVIMGIVLAMPVLPTQAIESFGVGGRPANPRPDNPRTNSIFVFTAEPGQTLTDAIKVINSNPGVREISVYATDSQISSDGAFACEQAADKKDDVGNWIKLDKNTVSLDTGKEETINFTVTVPTNASVGEHNGCIAIQDMTNKTAADENGIALSFRSALRVAITIPGEVVNDLKLDGVTLANQKDNKLIITPTFTNKGNVSVDTTIDARLVGLFGVGNQTTGGEFPVLRDSSAKFNFEVNKPFWGGWYEVKVAATYKPLSANEDQRKNTNEHSQRLFIWPHPIALAIEILILVLILGGIIWWLTRHRRRKQLHASARIYVVQAGDDIQNIASRAGINWQLIARLNNLQPPYILNVGQRLRIPQQKASNKSEN